MVLAVLKADDRENEPRTPACIVFKKTFPKLRHIGPIFITYSSVLTDADDSTSNKLSFKIMFLTNAYSPRNAQILAKLRLTSSMSLHCCVAYINTPQSFLSRRK